jgi:plasmid replication initiation protein
VRKQHNPVATQHNPVATQHNPVRKQHNPVATQKHPLLIKADGAIHSEHPLSLVQQRLWDVLLANAYNDLVSAETYSVSITEIFEQTGHSIDTLAQLDECLKALLHTEHRWNLLKKDERVWGATTAIAAYELSEKRGELRFSFSPELRSKLTGGTYTKFELAEQVSHHSKYGMVLSQLLHSYYRARHARGETGWIALEDFRALMGIGENEYPRWDRLKERMIVEPLAEIASSLPFTVELSTQKRVRKIRAIKFVMKHRRLAGAGKTARTTKAVQASSGNDSKKITVINPAINYDAVWQALTKEQRAAVEREIAEQLPLFLRDAAEDSVGKKMLSEQRRNEILSRVLQEQAPSENTKK